MEDFYVDDVLSGADTIDEATECRRQLQALLSRGGFSVHKWCSNSQEFLQPIPQEDREKHVTLSNHGTNKVIKVLGLLWEPNLDCFLIANIPTSVQDDLPTTKRKVYAEVARLFDPLGLFAPVIVMAKILVQQLWKISVGWDEPIDEENRQAWLKLQQALPQLSLIQIPRCAIFPGAVTYELHGFADASPVAYGACVYLRSVFADGSAKARLLTSKSKVAPLRDLSIPRLELCAALLLSRLVSRLIPTLQLPLQTVILWSDSMIVLAWLIKPLDQLQTFVRNRIVEIQTATKEYQWNYVRSENNPADIVSRGQLPMALSQNCLWWNGPSFLTASEHDIEQPILPEKELPEIKIIAATMVTIQPFPVFTRFSCFRKIQRIMAYVLRFIRNCRKSNSERLSQPQLTVRELRRSTEAIIKVIQLVHLGDEIQRLQSNQPCKRINNLRPIYDGDLLRVGGRLDNSRLPFASKHQIILPNQDPVTKLLIKAMHVELLHVGQSGLINALRQRYWLINARSTVRQVVRQCVKCFRTNPDTTTQLMGNLPESRVVPSPPFAVTGVDYAGPVIIK